MRKVQLLVVSFVAVAATACNFDFNSGITGIKGSGKVVSESRSVAGFTGVSLKGTGQLLIDTNGTESLEITGDDNLLPEITSEIKGGELVLGTKDNGNISPSKELIYKLSAKTLDSIELAGSGEIDAKGINTSRLKVLLGGSGNISAAGTTERQEVTIAGSGNYRGENLKTKASTVSIAGSGDADVDASEKLDVTVAGSGSVKYTGDPKVTQNILGSGSVEKR
jgi:Putative auto-transporter adhesin, head GIN domain